MGHLITMPALGCGYYDSHSADQGTLTGLGDTGIAAARAQHSLLLADPPSHSPLLEMEGVRPGT